MSALGGGDALAGIDKDFEAILAAYPQHVQAIAVAVRKLIFATLPQPLEMIEASPKIVGYGFGHRYADLVCSLIPSKTGVKLGLAYGASLPDPTGLLEGEGKVHRHIAFRSAADVKKPGVKALLKSALAAQQSRSAKGIERRPASSRA